MEIDSERVLAQIVKITNIMPIKDADQIELANVLGWDVVIKKNDFHVNDLAIYFTIDSVLDGEKEYCNFLQGKRLKTKKIRGVVSQGLLGPLQWLNYHDANYNVLDLKEGDNVTQKLNVKKYINPTEEYIYKNICKSTFPDFCPKTDEERIQNIPYKIKNLVGKKIVVTKKFDGTSATFIHLKTDSKFLICSRNNIVTDFNDNSYLHFFEMSKKYNLEEKMQKLNKNIAIQGEICGPKINGNRLKLKENDLFVFNIYDIESEKYLLWDEVIDITRELNLKTVDVVYYGDMKTEWLTVNKLLELADSQTYIYGDICEGIVIKTDDAFGRISFKVISNKFLLKHGL